jgi:hypothetical protein
MRTTIRRFHKPLLILMLIVEVVLAFFFLFIGVAAFVSPNVPMEALTENILVGSILILCAAVLIYAFFRPYWGGLFLCICAVPFGFIFNAFHVSHALYPSREVGYHPFWSAMTGLILLVGVLSVIRGRLRRRKVDG